MAIGRLVRTLQYLKLRQIWYQVWRRIQKGLEAHPKCGGEELPEFTFLNLTARPKGWNDASLDMLWRYNLHYFDCLAAKNAEDAKLVERWIAENPKGSIPGWDPYPTSLRIVNWVKYLNNNPELPASQRLSIENSLRDQLYWLSNHVEWHIMANHLMANLKALIIGNKWFGRESVNWMRLYKAQIAEQMLPDGGHFERSIMYHAIMLEDVLDVMKFCGDDATWLKPVTEKMLLYLVNMTGPDGKIAMFNDAADGIAKPTDWLVDYAKQLGFEAPVADPFADFPDTGYTLTYELYYKGRKIVTDVGTSEYRGKRRAFERSTAAHNVAEIDGRNSSEVWSSHRVGARARIVDRQVEPGHIFAAHDGYGFRMGRELVLTENGLEVKERVDGRGECVTRVHVCSGVKYTQDAENVKISELTIEGLDDIEEFEYAVEFGKLEKGACLSRSFDGGELCYSIKEDSTPTV